MKRDETIEKALRLTDHPEERGAVFRGLAEQIPDPERALMLIDRVRSNTRNGDDLFYLHLAVEELEQKHKDVRPAARALLERFFDHIPAPPRGLFETIETRDGSVPLFREIDGDSYWMGSAEGEGNDDEHPRHLVEVAAFRMAVVPVTVKHYQFFDPNHQPHEFEASTSSLDDPLKHPVQLVSWFAATSFCRWLACQTGFEGAGLPSEEEWEFAARAGSEDEYWSGNDEQDLARVGWYRENSEDRTHTVAELPANPWGLFDVHGNVWEWCESRWRANYDATPEGDSQDPTIGRRVLRGGSWFVYAHMARSVYRVNWYPDTWDNYAGFRVRLPALPSSEGGS